MPLPPDELAARARRIRLAVFDVDGVLTDGLLHYGPQGEAWKTFHVRDGHGIVLLRLAGVPSAVLTGRESEAVRARMRELGVRHVVTGCRDKRRGLEALLTRAGVAPDEAAYMGDDVNDLPAFDLAGLTACPADAAPDLLARAHFVARATGGRGAARELCDLLLASRPR